MKPLRLAPLFTLLALGHTAAPDVKHMIEAQYAAISAAFKKNDIHSIEKILAPDFTIKPTTGPERDRAYMLKDIQHEMTMMHDVSWERHVTKVDKQGMEVKVTVAGHFTGKFKTQDGKTHVFDLHSMANDTWTFHGSSLQLKRSEATKLDAKVDGKAPGGG